MLLMIDNYDSFTFNLVQYFYELGQEVEVHRNDLISIKDIEKKSPQYLVISPGPCTPREAGISVELIKAFKDKLPILGVCLGHQGIGHTFGGKIINSPIVLKPFLINYVIYEVFVMCVKFYFLESCLNTC